MEGIKKQKKSKHKRIEEFKDFLTVLPALIFFGVFIYYPLGELFRISFTNWNLIKDDFKYVGFRNYNWLFNGSGWDQLVNALKVTFTYTIAEVFVTLVFGLLLALLFNKMTKMYNSFRTILFMPKYIGVSTAGIVFTWILNGRYGILNYILGTFGINGPDWLTNEKTALAGVLILTTWRVVGYAMLIYLSAMQGIAKDYYEAASLDGASKTQQFFRITIPLLSPTTLFLFVTTFIASMKVFQSIDVMTGGGPYKATNVMVYWIYRLAFVEFRVDRASVVAVLFFLILLIITAITMRISENTVNYDG